ncbi:MAG TPA: 5-formyltetrahydrofolate cyclo-ligase [Chthoniobacterales bacterium]|jgi:5-formyltetrahydrofolate cyclo-ligase
MISTEKQILRARVLAILRAMTPAERAARSAIIAGHLANLRGFVFGFAPLKSEVNWLSAAREGAFALPRIEDGRLRFHRITSLAELVPGAFGAREPIADAATLAKPGEADVVLVPGLAFDRDGGRLGRGGGFYDRFLADPAVRARRVAVAFADQIVERVPTEAHDVHVDAIVTEDGWLERRSSGLDRD